MIKKTEKMHDSGKRQHFKTGAVRDTAEEKTRPELISPWAIIRIGNWLKLGARKYGEGNWTRGMPYMRVIASILRHTLALILRKTDEDHAAAIATNAIFIMHYDKMVELGLLPTDIDDRSEYFAVDWNGIGKTKKSVSCPKYGTK